MRRSPMAGLRRFGAFVFAAEDARRLAALRIGLCGLLAWRLAVNDYGFVADQPAALYQPVSFMHLLPEMPSAELAEVARGVGIGAALLAAAGLLTRISLPVAFAAALLLGGMLNSTGKIIHNDVLLMLALVPLLAAPTAASAAWSLRDLSRGSRPADRRSPAPVRGVAYGWPVRTAMIVVALAYFFVGVQKLRFSGVEWVTSENLRWVLYGSSDTQAEPNGLALFVADRVWLVHLMAAATLTVELLFPLALAFRRLRWLFVPAVVVLHLGIWLAMGLDYSAQALTVVIVFVDWPLLVAWLAGARRSPTRSRVRRQPGWRRRVPPSSRRVPG